MPSPRSSRGQSDLADARAELADAQKGPETARAEAADAAGEKAALERQVADLTGRLAAAAQRCEAPAGEQYARRAPPVRPSAAARQAPPPAPRPPAGAHVVVDGDTLSGISLGFYGTARRWPDIYQANRDVLPNEPSLAWARRSGSRRGLRPRAGEVVRDVGDLADPAAAHPSLEVGVLLGLHLDLVALLLVLLRLLGDPLLLVEDVGHAPGDRGEDQGRVLDPAPLHELEEAGVELVLEPSRKSPIHLLGTPSRRLRRTTSEKWTQASNQAKSAGFVSASWQSTTQMTRATSPALASSHAFQASSWSTGFLRPSG